MPGATGQANGEACVLWAVCMNGVPPLLGLLVRAPLCLVITAILLGGCTTVQTNSYGQAPIVNDVGNPGQDHRPGHIQILYAEPKRDYESLGTFSVRKYKPGWSDPTVSDAIPELKQAALGLGGQAVIIRSTSSNGYTRFITIEGEAIRWR